MENNKLYKHSNIDTIKYFLFYALIAIIIWIAFYMPTGNKYLYYIIQIQIIYFGLAYLVWTRKIMGLLLGGMVSLSDKLDEINNEKKEESEHD